MTQKKTDQLAVYYKGKLITHLKKSLLDKQNAWNNLEELKKAYQKKCEIYEAMENTDDPGELRGLDEECVKIEFCLQELWGFKKNKRFHRFWERPKCLCAKIDNIDLYPDLQWINQGCPLHGCKIKPGRTKMTNRRPDIYCNGCGNYCYSLSHLPWEQKFPERPFYCESCQKLILKKTKPRTVKRYLKEEEEQMNKPKGKKKK